jgi:hypothetical protein
MRFGEYPLYCLCLWLNIGIWWLQLQIWSVNNWEYT